ncbi:MAG TPA: OmpA family protein [Bryobacteraceae bacterium]|nr:OmpA family protein [Bryobacteraceae bacterium]
MAIKLALLTAPVVFLTSVAWPQTAAPQDGTVPIYRVTVIERTVRAVNYQYRSGPTQIDFRGTVLMPAAKGDAIVESKSGRTEIEAKFDRVDAPTRFGAEYLTYVLWAITPDGHAKNLGEVLTNSSDKSRLRVTTDLQSFGLIVTAEPYAAVRLPSDVVVMENVVRPDTMATTQPINVKYELMPRGAYTYNVPAQLQSTSGPRLSMDRYESLVEVYQAQNAVQIAESQGAAKYAPEIFSRAEQQLRNAQQLNNRRADRNTVVTAARQAAETAEDARTVAMQRQRDQELAKARDEVAVERQRRIQAEAAAQQAQTEAAAHRQTIDGERGNRHQAEAMTEAATGAPAPPPPLNEPAAAPMSESANRPDNQQQLDLRVSLLRQLNSALDARDTPRGLVVTVPEADFRGNSLNPVIAGSLARIAQIVAAHPGLMVEVEGNCDAPGNAGESMAYQRAETVRAALVQAGLPTSTVDARSLGSSRLIASNASPNGREQNRRVEIVVVGSAIGSLPYWDKPYSLNPR